MARRIFPALKPVLDSQRSTSPLAGKLFFATSGLWVILGAGSSRSPLAAGFRMPQPMRSRLIPGLLALATAAATLVFAQVATAQLQIILPTPAPIEEETSQSSHLRRLPSNPLASAELEGIRGALEQGRIVPALESLQQLIELEPDFFENNGRLIGGSFLDEAETLVRSQRAEYERLFGPTAQQLLDEARKSQDRGLYEELVRRFGMTTAGGSALRELARLDRDRGETGRAAACLEQWSRHPACAEPTVPLSSAFVWLRDGGELAAAQALRERHSTALENLNVPADAPRALAPGEGFISQSRTQFGDVNHLGNAPVAPAITHAWSADLLHPYDFEALASAPQLVDTLVADNLRLIRRVETQLREAGERVTFPASRPLIVGDVVLAAGPASFKAFRLADGKLEGSSVDVDETFDHLAVQTFSSSEISDASREEKRDLLARARGWRDLTSCSLSTDGHTLYAVLDCQLVGTTTSQRVLQSTQKHPLLPRRENRLVALDIGRDLKKRWPLPDTAELFDAPLAPQREIFYLGAPLPVDGRLYVLGEERGQVQLFELDPRNGEILWSIGLLNPDSSLVLDARRRLSGLTPAWGGGLLICPAGEDVISAVDPLLRRVVWTHSYAGPGQTDIQAIQLRRNLGIQSFSLVNSANDLLDDERWFDARVLVTGERVVFTPPDRDLLLCLNLRTGKPAWSVDTPRTRLLSIAAATEDNLILVGRRHLTALRLADGAPAWPQPVPIPWPSGRGVRMGNQFLQPLSTGEIAVIDLPAGRILARLPLPQGMVPGNLATAGGRLLCQSASGIQAFQSAPELEAVIREALVANPRDAQALRMRGELALQQGQLRPGLNDLRAALIAGDSARARHVLRSALLDGLRTDFAANLPVADELEKLLESPEQKLDFLGALSAGHLAAGETRAAFNACLRILEESGNAAPRELDNAWSVSATRWGIGRLQMVLESAGAMRPLLLGDLTTWVRDRTSDELAERLLGDMPADWVPAEITLQRLRRVPFNPVQAHWRDSVLSPLLNSPSEPVRMEAAWQLAELALALGHAPLANDMIAFLEKSTVPLLGQPEVTAAALARRLRQDSAWEPLLSPTRDWPRRLPVLRTQQNQNYARTYQVPQLGARSPRMAGWTFFMDQSNMNVEILNSSGEHCGQAATNQSLVRYGGDSDFPRQVFTSQHLASVVLHDRYIILDTLTDASNPRSLGVHSLLEAPESNADARFLLSSTPGLRSHLAKTLSGPAGTVGPLLPGQICQTVGAHLVALEPHTGRELWRRRDLPPGCEVLADEEHVLAKPLEQDVLRIYRASDGAFLRQVPLPEHVLRADARSGGDWGCLLPRVVPVENGRQWQMYDPVGQRVVWSHPLEGTARWTTVAGADIAFLHADGRFSICEARTGRALLEARVPLHEPVELFTVVQSPGEWVLLPGRSEFKAPLSRMYGISIPPDLSCVLSPVHGQACAFERSSGRMLWNRLIEHQQALTLLPVDWPILAFSSLPPGTTQTSSLILNRATGEEIWSGQQPLHNAGMGFLGKAAPRQIQLRFGPVWVLLGQDEQPEAARPPQLPPPQRE